jgi:hypothetical protein
VDSSTVTLSSTATATGTGVSLAFWPKATMVGCTTGALRADPPVGSPPAITVSRITIPPGSAPANCAPVSHFKLSLDRIQNPSLRGRTAPFDMKFLSGAVTLEEHTGTVFIGEPASRLQAPTTTFTGLPADRVITLQVQALDSIGNGVPGIIIAWTRPSGTGTLLATTSITDDSGFASADFKVGAGGAAATVKATAPGTLTGNPVTFNINQAGTTGGGGNVAHLTVTSTPTTASADSASFVLTATGTDSSNANLGDVTSTTTFTIAPDGTCTGHTCTATTAGSHTITGNNGGTTATTPVTVTGGAAKSIQADAGTLPVQAPGGTQQIKAKVLDAHSNPVSGVTVTWTVQSGGGSLASATSTSGADGFAQNTVTTGSTAGDNIVTATFTGNTGPDASFTVTSAAVGSITPLQGTLNTVAGAAVTLEAVVKDASGNHLVGATVTWTTPDTGSLGGVTSVSGANGIASNTFTRSGTGSVTIQAAVGSLTPAAFHVSITPGPVDHITISPLTANVDAGETKAFTVTAFDSHGNSIGDVTSAATFDISPDGQCNGSVCSADEAGDHTVTATKSGRTATATLDVKGTTTTTSQPSPSIGFAAVVIALVGQLLLVRRRSR